MRKNNVLSVLFLILSLTLAARQSSVRKAPDFEVSSGDHKIMNLAGLKPYKVTICFYECRDVTELNREFKDRLLSLHAKMDESTKNKIFILSVGDCTAAKWPFVGLWEAALVEKSKKNGWTVFGDWTGKMREAFSFVEGDSNFAIINSNGMILYQTSGKIDSVEVQIIEDLINSLLL